MVLRGKLGGLRRLMRGPGGADIGNEVFKLHYSITTSILVIFCLFVTASTLILDPISCRSGGSGLSEKFVNMYCWSRDTFTLSPSANQYPPGYDGLRDGSGENTLPAYYIFIPLLLFLQAILFYIPHWIWRTLEGKKISSLAVGLSSPLMSNNDEREKIELLADYLVSSLHSNNLYAIKFIMCEALNLINVILNILFVGDIIRGPQNQDDAMDSKIILFPRLLRCIMYLRGPSGTIEMHDFLCTMSMSIINQSIYVILWFWFCLLSILSGLAIFYRIVVVFSPTTRVNLLNSKAKFKHPNVANVLSKKLSFGDYFLFHLIGKNVESVAFSSLINAVYFRLDPSRINVNKPDMELYPRVAPDQYGPHSTGYN